MHEIEISHRFCFPAYIWNGRKVWKSLRDSTSFLASVVGSVRNEFLGKHSSVNTASLESGAIINIFLDCTSQLHKYSRSSKLLLCSCTCFAVVATWSEPSNRYPRQDCFHKLMKDDAGKGGCGGVEERRSHQQSEKSLPKLLFAISLYIFVGGAKSSRSSFPQKSINRAYIYSTFSLALEGTFFHIHWKYIKKFLFYTFELFSQGHSEHGEKLFRLFTFEKFSSPNFQPRVKKLNIHKVFFFDI